MSRNKKSPELGILYGILKYSAATGLTDARTTTFACAPAEVRVYQ